MCGPGIPKGICGRKSEAWRFPMLHVVLIER